MKAFGKLKTKYCKDTDNAKFMQMALGLAKKGEGKTSPNPMVGAIIVKDGKVVGRGYHKRVGGAHAEIIALKEAGNFSKGATLYVNLEPCCHFGRTPPCTDAIIKAGIKRVVVSMSDPNPINNGKSFKILRRHNIKVNVGLLNSESKHLNEIFIKYITTNFPFVTVKIAQSLDGKIATKFGESKWITGKDARRFVHRLRKEVDAVLVGVNTIIKDNPLLTARNPFKNPFKVILDSSLKTPLDSRIFSKDSPSPNIIVTTKGVSLKKISRYEKIAKVLIAKTKNGKIGLRDLLRRLTRLEISHVLVEGGGSLVASFLEDGLVDKVLIFISPKIIGGQTSPTSVEGRGINRLSQAIKLKNFSVRKFGKDLLVEGYPEYGQRTIRLRH